MKPRIILAFVMLACTASMLPVRAEDRVLFSFDDHSIPWRHNLKVTLVAAEKHPDNPVLRRGPEGAPDHGHAILYGTVLKDGDTFRMWYLGMIQTEIEKGQAPGWWRPMCYAESKDGVHWTKPELGLVELNGNKKNNICLIEGPVHSMTRVNDFLSVLYEPNDPDPSRRYKVAYIAHMPYDDIKGGMSNVGVQEQRVGATVCATSADGLSWEVVGDRPANAGGERFEVSSLYRFSDFYYSTGQLLSPWTWRADGSKTERQTLVFRSPDFQTWSQASAHAYSRPGQLTTPPVAGEQGHMGMGLWNRGNVMVGLHGMWQDAATSPEKGEHWNKGVHVDLGLVVSNDGVHFREPVPNFKVIARGEPGAWDDTALLQGHAFVNHADKTMIWYSHWDTSGQLKTMEIGLATLRRDGFGYLSAQEKDNDSEFITDFFELDEEDTIYLNVSGVSPNSPLTVELLDHRAQPIPEYSVAISTSGVHVPVVWPRPAHAGQKRALRVRYPVASPARVYAIYVSDRVRPSQQESHDE
ncbi:glycoside hydrolase family protein [Aureliella helgolandensis]|uniref:Glycosyl hydrolases family 43 n=1 Tax=Aureliella helgolandensis TaxID=2527968 RepID=A0A518GCS8_9BACT|nr:hypothetical protein [Aureliella helgolandensis]QDV26388.1 hypothetical protein Q31a_47620 [Aureliella helgolandensis]